MSTTTTSFALPPLHLPQQRLHRKPRRAPVCRASPQITNTKPTFADIEPALPSNLLSRVSSIHKHPTQTQQQALPPLLRGKDVLLHAPTGTGKTLCYLLTCLTHIKPTRASAQVLILVPTPELGAQVIHTFQKLSDLPFASLLDGDSRALRMALRTGPRVVLGTPVTVWAMKRYIRLDLVRILVVDEFDACLGSSESTRALVGILSVHAKEDRQTVLCSATVPQHRHFLKRAMREGWLKKDVMHVRAEQEIAIPESIQHAYVICDHERKIDAVGAVVRRFKGQVIVFVSESRDVDDVVERLDGMVDGGVVGIRREWGSGERRHMMKKFRQGTVRTLVATDMAARGIDIPQIVGVVQMDLPRDGEGYIHRAGRAGRMGRRGWSILVITEGERFVINRFSNFLDIEFKQLGK